MRSACLPWEWSWSLRAIEHSRYVLVALRHGAKFRGEARPAVFFRLRCGFPVVCYSQRVFNMFKSSVTAQEELVRTQRLPFASIRNTRFTAMPCQPINRSHLCPVRPAPGAACALRMLLSTWNVGKYQNGTSYTRVSARHNWDALAPLWVNLSKGFRAKNVQSPSSLPAHCRSWEHVVFATFDRIRLPTLFLTLFTLLKFPLPNRNHRRKLYSTRNSTKSCSSLLSARVRAISKKKKRFFEADTKKEQKKKKKN